jgi:hypothetical protein
MRASGPETQPENADDELLAALRVALQPEPLPASLVDRIQMDFDQRTGTGRPRGLPKIHLIGLAAAACLLVAVMLPPENDHRAARQLAPLTFSSEEAAEIVAAYGLLSWDCPVDYTLSALDTTLDDLERTLRGDASGDRMLPWGREDDWDVPPATEEAPSRSRATGEWLCMAASERAYRRI